MFCLLNPAIVWRDLSLHRLENKVNLTFYSQVKSQTSVLNTGLEEIGIKELIYKVVTYPVFVVADTIQTKESLVKCCTYYGLSVSV